MTLWDVLTIASGSAAFAGAWTAAKHAQFQPRSIVVALLGGLVIGACCIWSVHQMGRKVFGWLHPWLEREDKPSFHTELVVAAVYGATVLVWYPSSFFLGHWLTKMLLELLP